MCGEDDDDIDDDNINIVSPNPLFKAIFHRNRCLWQRNQHTPYSTFYARLSNFNIKIYMMHAFLSSPYFIEMYPFITILLKTHIQSIGAVFLQLTHFINIICFFLLSSLLSFNSSETHIFCEVTLEYIFQIIIENNNQAPFIIYVP